MIRHGKMGYSKVSDSTNVPNAGSSSAHPILIDGEESQFTSAFRFMDLPQELREKVYEGLLCPHTDRTQHRRYDRIRNYGLQPSILRTCKQIHEEAARVLYTKNGTALIQMDAQAHQILKTEDNAMFRYPELISIARVECGKVGGEPVLTMEVSVLEQYQTKPKPATRKRAKGKRGKGKSVPEDQVEPEKPVVFIGLSSALPKFYRAITSCLCAKILQLVVNMERPFGLSSKTRQPMLSDYLECCREARGLGRAVILTGPQNSDTAAKMAGLMMTGLETYEDVSSIACAYEARAMKQVKEEKWNYAQDTLQSALDFFDWGWEHSPHTHDLEEKKIELQWKYISCCLKTGRTGDLHHQIRRMFRRCSPNHRTAAQQTGYWDRLADAHYAIGMAYVIDEALNSATYSFLQALLTTPGHVKTDKAIDELEQRVMHSTDPEDVMVKLNIESVLKGVRHQVSDQQRLTQNQAHELVSGFRATYRSIQYLLDSEYSVVDLSIMEPLNPQRFFDDDDDDDDEY